MQRQYTFYNTHRVVHAAKDTSPMYSLRSLLLGTASGLVTEAGEQAADLSARRSAPVDHLRICAVYGPGFFYIPGSDTCIKLGGRALFEYVNGNAFNRGTDVSSFNAVGRFAVDTMTSTDWGLLRAFIRLDFIRSSGFAPLGSFGSPSAD